MRAGYDELSFPDFSFGARIGFIFVHIVIGTGIGLILDWSVIVPDSYVLLYVGS